MPTILASQIISRARTLLQDTAGVRWSDTECLGWLSDAQREIASLRSDASSKYAPARLVAGTRQAMPSDAIELIDIPRNLGTDGLTPGYPVRKVERTFLDENIPTWHTDTASSVTRHFAYDTKALKFYWVYPPSDGTGYVDLLYAFPPSDISSTGSVIGVDDIYANALMFCLLSFAYAKNADDPGDAQRAAAARTSFENALAGKSQTDATNVRDPKET